MLATRFPLDEIPFIPAKVDIADVIDTGGRLIAQEDIASVKAAIKFLKQGLDGRYSKKDLETKFSIAKIDGQYYAIYKGAKHDKHLGKGSFGTAKLVQNIDDGTWAVMKTIVNTDGTSNKYAIEREVTQLKFVHHFLGQPPTRVSESKKAEQDIIIMKLAPGLPVDIIVKNKKRNMPPVKWLDMALGISRAVSDLLDKGVLHRDIKPANILFDPATGIVTIIDYGLGRKIDKENPDYYSSRGVGSPRYLAPEARTPDKQKVPYHAKASDGYSELTTVPYNESTEVFALGMTLMDIFGFTKTERGIDVEITLSRRITNPHHLKEILALLPSMTDSDPFKRPDMKRVLEVLTDLREHEIDLYSKVNMLGYINVDDYLKASEFQKAETLKAAQAADVVMLCCIASENSGLECMRLKHELEGMGVCVLNHAVHLENDLIDTITHTLKENVKRLSLDHDVIYRARYISPLSFQEGEKYSHVTPRNLDRVEINEVHKYIATDKIGKQITRLQKKNEEDIRLQYLRRFQHDLEEGKIKTYDQLFGELNTLEGKMNAGATPSKLKIAASKIGLHSSTSAKKVKKAVRDIDKDAIGFKKAPGGKTL